MPYKDFKGIQKKEKGTKVKVNMSWMDKSLTVYTFVPFTPNQTAQDVMSRAIENVKEGSIFEYGKFQKEVVMSYVLENKDKTDHRVFDTVEADDLITSIKIM